MDLENLPPRGKKWKPRSEEAARLFTEVLNYAAEVMKDNVDYDSTSEMLDDLTILSTYKILDEEVRKGSLSGSLSGYAAMFCGNSEGGLKTSGMFLEKVVHTVMEELDVSKKEAVNHTMILLKKILNATLSGQSSVHIEDVEDIDDVLKEAKKFGSMSRDELNEVLGNKIKKQKKESNEDEMMSFDEILKGISSLSKDDISSMSPEEDDEDSPF